MKFLKIADWNRFEKILYLFFLSIFILLLLAVGLLQVIGENVILQYETSFTLKGISAKIDEFYFYLKEFPVFSKLFITTQEFEADQIDFFHHYHLPLLIAFGLGISVVKATISSIRSSFWYYVGTGLFIFLFVFLNLDILNSFVWPDGYLVIVLALYVIPSFYLHAFKSELSFIWRLLIFSVITLVASIFIIQFTQQQAPLFFLAHYGYEAIAIVAIIFIFIISYDNLLIIFRVSSLTSTKGSKNGLVNFCIFAIVYLGNLLLMFLKNTNNIDWNIYYLNPFILYGVSCIAGIWGNFYRKDNFEFLYPFRPVGGLAFLAGGIICHAAIAYASLTENSAMIEVFEDAIIYTHLASGLMFVLYILINFGFLMSKGMAVHKVVWEPKFLGTHILRLASLGVFIIILTSRDFFPAQQFRAAMYNFQGDAYMRIGRSNLAYDYFNNGYIYDHENFRSNYVLAKLNQDNGYLTKAIEFYNRTNKYDPRPHSYINLAQVYKTQGRQFYDLITLKEGLEKFPDSYHIKNNLGLAFHRMSISDSALFFMEKAAQASKNDVAASNLLAISLINNDLQKCKFYVENTVIDEDYALGNKIAAKYITGTAVEIDSVGMPENYPDITDFCAIYNQSIVKKGLLDSVSYERLQGYIKSDTTFFDNYLDWWSILHNFYHKDVKNAVYTLQNNAEDLPDEMYVDFMNTMGTWLLTQENPSLAYEYFHKAAKPQIIQYANDAALNRALTAMQLNDSVADKSIAYLLSHPDTTYREFGALVQSLSPTMSQGVINRMPDRTKYYFIQKNQRSVSDSTLYLAYFYMDDPEVKSNAAIGLMDHFLKKNNQEYAQSIWSMVPEDGQSAETENKLNFTYLALLEKFENYTELARKSQEVTYPAARERFKSYFMARALEEKNDTTAAGPYYENAVKQIGLSPKVILDAVRFYENDLDNKDKAYNILVEMVRLQPDHPDLLQHYALLCLRLNYLSYAEESYEDLKQMLSPIEFIEFANRYETELQKAEENLKAW